ncbi:ATP-binding protein [Bacteroidota bacterium]
MKENVEKQIPEQPEGTNEETLTVGSKRRYKKLLKLSIISAIIVSITPLIIMAVVNYYQYQKAFKADIIYPISRQTSNIRNSLESFIEERRSALKLIIKEKQFEELNKQDQLAATLRHLKESFDGFVDLSVINSKGDQVAYVGPYNLVGKNYNTQDWFHEVSIKGTYISDVFMGYRGLPHFIIAIVEEKEKGDFYVLRATIDSDMLYNKILSQNLLQQSDAFLINGKGILQTPSKFHGSILEKTSFPVPSYSPNSEVIEQKDSSGKTIILGFAYVNNSPFILMETTNPEFIMGNWLTVRNNLIGFLGVSIILILIVIIWGSNRMVHQIRLSDLKRYKIIHKIEYTDKMASIGRLAAGVAHEINNPLAIINENAGMLKDILSASEDFTKKGKMNKYLNSIINSVDRCSKITHRLLGFAKRMDTHHESIQLDMLLKEVVSFIEREALRRNVKISILSSEQLPEIESDRGQLQQVFLNIINNALQAVKDGDTITIDMKQLSSEFVSVSVTDNGPGIPKRDLEKIFEPFFTTKKETGTGLGLSITYGIVQKLGGKIKAESEVGKGTTFTVTLPLKYSKNEE